MRSGIHRDLSFWSKSRCFACKSHRWGLGRIETNNSDAKHAVVHAQNDKSCHGPIETCHSRPEVTVLHAKCTGGVLDPQRPVFLVLKSRFCMHNTAGEDWNPYGLDILVLSTLLCMLKTTVEVWDPYRLVLLVQSRCFACTKPQMIVGTHRDKLFWS